jgi:hypothetical protein
MPSCQFDDEFAMSFCSRPCRHDQPAIRLARELSNNALDLTGVTQID